MPQLRAAVPRSPSLIASSVTQSATRPGLLGWSGTDNPQGRRRLCRRTVLMGVGAHGSKEIVELVDARRHLGLAFASADVAPVVPHHLPVRGLCVPDEFGKRRFQDRAASLKSRRRPASS